MGYIESYLRFSKNPGAQGEYLIKLLIWATVANTYLVCCLGSGKRNVTIVALHEFDISMLMLLK